MGGLLNTHPQVACMDEPMNPAVNRADVPGKTIAETFWQQSDKPVRGFIIHWNQHSEAGGPGEGFLDDLHEDVRVVWLIRRDALASIVSRKICEITGGWRSPEPTAETLTLTPSELCAAYEELMHEQEEISAWVQRRAASIFVSYEDAVRQPDLKSIQAFLGVDFAPLSLADCGAVKREWRRLSTVVRNYHELKREFAHAPMAALFRPQHL